MERRPLRRVQPVAPAGISVSASRAILAKFPKTRILVVGDLMLDEFVWGTVDRISPEAPVPVVWVTSESFMPGGASNVANNLRAMGGRVMVAGVIGSDGRGRMLLEELRNRGIDTAAVVVDAGRPTTLKTRVVAHHQQVVRIDRERTSPIARGVLDRLVEAVARSVRRADAVIIEDYGKGVIGPALIQELLALTKRRKCLVTVDPKEDHIMYYRGVTAITPNLREAQSASGLPARNEMELRRVGQTLLARLACEMVLVTRGEEGMSLFERDGRQTNIPTMAQEVFDVSGAGDTVIATFTTALAVGANPVAAARLANCAAGVVVGKVGVATAAPEEILRRVRQ